MNKIELFYYVILVRIHWVARSVVVKATNRKLAREVFRKKYPRYRKLQIVKLRNCGTSWTQTKKIRRQLLKDDDGEAARVTIITKEVW